MPERKRGRFKLKLPVLKELVSREGGGNQSRSTKGGGEKGRRKNPSLLSSGKRFPLICDGGGGKEEGHYQAQRDERRKADGLCRKPSHIPVGRERGTSGKRERGAAPVSSSRKIQKGGDWSRAIAKGKRRRGGNNERIQCGKAPRPSFTQSRREKGEGIKLRKKKKGQKDKLS